MQEAILRNKTKIRQKQPKKKNKLREYYVHRHLFIMLIPVLVYYLVFHYAPMYGILIAFKDFSPVEGILKSDWAGFQYFREIFSGMFFWSVFKNTLIISFYKLLFGFPAPIILCLMLNEVKRPQFKKTVQTITYLPHFLSWIVLSGLVIEILSPSRGPINIILQNLGFEPIFFIAEPKWFRTILISSSIWKSAGWSSITYLAAVTNIDPELYDVADLDGAGRLRKIWNVTLPSVLPVIIIMFIFAVGRIINDDFDQVYNLLNAKVMSVGDVISTYTYREGLQRMNYSYATAIGLFKNIISFTLVVLSNYIASKFSEYSLW